MIEEKIPTWDMFKEYSDEIASLLMILFCAANKNYQMRVWCRAEGPEVEWYAEWSFGFDNYVEDLDRELTEGKVPRYLSKAHIERLYKIYYMVEEFEEKYCQAFPKAQTHEEGQLRVINHPEWDKIRQYAGETLQMILSDYEASKNSYF